jgi:hypothetical protein
MASKRPRENIANTTKTKTHLAHAVGVAEGARVGAEGLEDPRCRMRGRLLAGALFLVEPVDTHVSISLLEISTSHKVHKYHISIPRLFLYYVIPNQNTISDHPITYTYQTSHTDRTSPHSVFNTLFISHVAQMSVR